MNAPSPSRCTLALSLALVLAACGNDQIGSPKPQGTVNEAEHKKDGGDRSGEKSGAADHKGGTEKSEQPSRIKLSSEELTSAGIKSETLEARELAAHFDLTATIRANQDRLAHVAPRVPARIAKVLVNLGDRVGTGQNLALLDSIELGEAHSAYQQALSQASVAKADLDRAERLRGEQIIPEKEYLRARGEYQKVEAQLRAATDKLKLLDVSVGSQGASISLFPVRAPFSGTVIEKNAVLGELAQPEKSMFTVADLSVLWIEANILERDLGKIKIGAPATVSVAAYPDETFRGKVTYISSTMEKETRSIPARIEVPNADGRLKPEMFANASIATGAAERRLSVPREAVLLVNGQSTVFLERAVGEYEPRAVEVEEASGGRVPVTKGLREGHRVVVSGGYALKARMLKSQIGDTH